MHATAAQSTSGGGARHIPLGKDTSKLPIGSFVKSQGRTSVALSTEPSPPNISAATLTISNNPNRRGGEWRINDQFSHRHPAWAAKNGFPTKYDPSDRPILFIAHVSGKFHARFSTEKSLRRSHPTLALAISGSRGNTGIISLNRAWLSALGIGMPESRLAGYEHQVQAEAADTPSEFNPKDNEDGRKKIVTEVVRRQGQPAFRKAILSAYEGQCAISGCDVEQTLEAAHITPYLGPQTNDPANGVLLRADLHTLFDLCLITIEASTGLVRISSKLKNSEYQKFSGKRAFSPKKSAQRASRAALEQHNSEFEP